MAIKYEAAINAMNEVRKAEREYVIDRMLGIIDEVSDEWLEDNCEWDWHGEMKKRVSALKEGEE